MPRQIGLSPKIVAQFLAFALTWVVVHVGLDVTPELAAAISAVAGVIAGYVTTPGAVAHDWPATSSDELLARQIGGDTAAPADAKGVARSIE